MKLSIAIPKAVFIARKWSIKHSPAICTGVGIALGAATIVTAVKATPKALYLIEQRKQEADIGANPEKRFLTTVDIIKVAWRPYIYPATLGALSVTSIILGQSINSRRIAALSAALSMSESVYSEYQDKVREVIGRRKEEDVRDKIAQDKVNDNPIGENEVINVKGSTLFYDATSGRYFVSDLEDVRRAINDLNRDMMSEMYISLNELYHAWGLSPTNIGDEIGWSLDDGLIDIRPVSTMISDDGRPCIVLEFRNHPRYEFNKLY